MLKRIIPFVILLPFSVFVLFSFLGCGTTGGGGSVVSFPKLFITNTQTREVDVIDISSSTIESRFLLPGRVKNWGALSPDGKKIYYPARDSNEIYVVNTETVTYEKTISVGSAPEDVEFSADGNWAVVAQNGQVGLINAQTDAFANSTSFIDATGQSYGIALNPVNNRFYVVCHDSPYILSFAVDSGSLTQVGTISSSSSMVDVSFPSNSGKMFVTRSTGTVIIYQATDEAWVKDLTGGSATCKMAVSPDGSRIYSCGTIGFASTSIIDSIDVAASSSIESYDVETDFSQTNANFSKGFAISPNSQAVYLYFGISLANKGRILKLDKDLTTYEVFADLSDQFYDFFGHIIYVP